MNFRWRLRCDASDTVEGWRVDDVRMSSGTCAGQIFADGFESGDTAAWSASVPP